MPLSLFLYIQKTSEHLWLANVFKWYRKGTVNRLKNPVKLKFDMFEHRSAVKMYFF